MEMSEDACRVCGKEDDEEYLLLCDGCDRPFHTQCHPGCVCCNTKPRNNFNRKPEVPEDDWYCKFCAGHLPTADKSTNPMTSIYAWGDHEDGQLGLAEITDKTIQTPTRVHELDYIGVLDIAVGETSTLILCNDTNLYSVGVGVSGQLGHQDIVHEKLSHFRRIESVVELSRSKGEGRFTQIHAGRDFFIAVTSQGHVYTWGNGEMGQLGHQENKIKKVPKKISALREMEIPIDLAVAGQDFVLFTSKESDDDSQFNTQKPGVFMSMGANAFGQLGDGTGRNQWVPQLLNKDGPDTTPIDNQTIDEPSEFLLGRDIKMLAAGKTHVLAVLQHTPGLWSWGHGEFGQLGHPKPVPAESESKFFRQQFRVFRPRFVNALAKVHVAQISCGGQHSIVLLNNGRVLGMGDNTYGQVGVPKSNSTQNLSKTSEDSYIQLPTAITEFGGDIQIKTISCGDEFSVALAKDGSVYTWGRGNNGQLGLGENVSASNHTPTKVPRLPAIKKIFVGWSQVFALEYTDETLPPPPVYPTSGGKKRGRQSTNEKNNKSVKSKKK